jgi:hypothetical protein
MSRSSRRGWAIRCASPTSGDVPPPRHQGHTVGPCGYRGIGPVRPAKPRYEFHARIPEQDAWKRQVLAREIELEEIDTGPFSDRYGPNSVQVTPRAAE